MYTCILWCMSHTPGNSRRSSTCRVRLFRPTSPACLGTKSPIFAAATYTGTTIAIVDAKCQSLLPLLYTTFYEQGIRWITDFAPDAQLTMPILYRQAKLLKISGLTPVVFYRHTSDIDLQSQESYSDDHDPYTYKKSRSKVIIIIIVWLVVEWTLLFPRATSMH